MFNKSIRNYSSLNNKTERFGIVASLGRSLVISPFSSYSQVRSVYSTSVLYMDNSQNISDNTALSEGNKDISLTKVDAEKLLAGLEEIKGESEEMSASEWIDANISSYTEAFPGLDHFRRTTNENTGDSLKLLKQISEDFLKDFSSLKADDLEILDKLLSSMPGENIEEKRLSFLLIFAKKLGVEEKMGGLSLGKESQDVSESFLSYDKGIININTNKFSLEKAMEFFKEHQKVVEFGMDIGSAFGGLMMYRGIMKVYDAKKTLDLSTFSSDNARLRVVRQMEHNRRIFATWGALIVMGGIYGIRYGYKSNTSLNVNVNVSNTSSSSSNNINSSIMLLFTQFKNLNKWFKLLIILLLIPVLIFILIFIVVPFKGVIFKYINYIVFIVGVLFISYFIMVLSLIEIFPKFNEKPKIYKYIPAFIKKEILNLYEISKLEPVNRSVVVNNTVFSLLCVIIIFLIYIIILLL